MTNKIPEFVTENADGSLAIRLAKPIVVDGVPQSVIQMREPTVGDEIAAQTSPGGSAGFEVTLFGNLTMLPPDALRAMTIRNYRRLQEAYRLFTD